MKRYIFIFWRGANSLFQIGFCRDIEKAIKAYKGIAAISILETSAKLIYLEEVDYQLAEKRLAELIKMGKSRQCELIEQYNPQWVELIPGENIQL